MNPSFQRKGGQWTSAQKAFLIDSIINNFDIPKLYFADFSYHLDSPLNEAKTKYAVIDGKQRLEAIFQFFDNKFPLEENFVYYGNPLLKVGGLFYKDLTSDYPLISEQIDNYNLSIYSVITDSTLMINQIFIRLNTGKQLTGAERRKAAIGTMAEAMKKLANDLFFREYLSVSSKSSNEENEAVKILLLEYSGGFVDTKRKDLDKFIDEGIDTEVDDAEDLLNRCTQVLSRMRLVFNPKDRFLKKLSNFTVLYLFFRQHLFGINEVDIFKQFLEYFFGLVDEKIGLEDSWIDESIVAKYNLMSRNNNDRGSIASRLEIMNKTFDEFLSKD